MNYEEREERLFVLRMFKFAFQVVSIALPPDLQKEYDKFSYDETSYFTDSITKAVLILMNENYDNIKDVPNIDSEDFRKISNEVALNYDPVKFLKFCSCFIMKAALGRCGETPNSYQAVWTAIENIFRVKRKNGGFDEETWDALDKVASGIVEEDDTNCRRLPNFDPNAELNLEAEKAFVLRVMQHVFRHYSKDLPEYYKYNVCILDEQGYHLSENVQKTLSCLMDIMLVPESKLGETGLCDYYHNISFVPFKEREFLEYCVCFSKKAVMEYYRSFQLLTPMQVFDSCVEILRNVRKKGLPTPWRKIEDVAIDILQEYEYRLEDKRLKKKFLDDLCSKSKRESDGVNTFVQDKKSTPKSDEKITPKADDRTVQESSEMPAPKQSEKFKRKFREIDPPESDETDDSPDSGVSISDETDGKSETKRKKSVN